MTDDDLRLMQIFTEQVERVGESFHNEWLTVEFQNVNLLRTTVKGTGWWTTAK